MCGIVGIFKHDGQKVEVSTIDLMTDALIHRGPDDRGIWTEGAIGLGHRRLSIRDLSPLGRQPMSDPEGNVWVTYNGEIYNDDLLKRELEREFGWVFKSSCDSELLPAGYLAWGTKLFDRLEGMFAVALWDRRSQELVLARDGVGIKPLYYSNDGGSIRFASELKAILADKTFRPALQSDALPAFLTQGYVSPSGSLLKNVEQVPPGTVRVIGKSGVRDRKFWQPTRNPILCDEREAMEGFRKLWVKVLGDVRVSDVPLGILQSGGIDSSLVTTFMGRDGRFPVFTAKFAEESHDESGLAKQISNKVGADHHFVPVDMLDDASELFAKVVSSLDGQLADSSAFAFYQLCAAVRRHVTVAVSGDGADEFFGGYQTYKASRYASAIQPFIPAAAASMVGSMLSGFSASDESRLPFTEILARFSYGLASPDGTSHAYWRQLIMPPKLNALLDQPGFKGLEDYENAILTAEGDLVDRCLLADQRHYLPADMLVKVDAMSMAHGLEIRVPFLDRRIMDFAGQLDHKLLTPLKGNGKKLLRQVLAAAGTGVGVTSAPKKGFNVPVARMLRTSLASLGDRLLDRDVERLAPDIKPEVARQMWRDHKMKKANNGYGLWALLTLAQWKQTVWG